MVFGGRKNAWQDVEVDETSFDKKLVPVDEIEVPERNMGAVGRNGAARQADLTRSSSLTKKRSLGPGPIRKDEWRTIADKWLKDKQIILDTDSAKAYKQKVRGVHHGSVVHQKKRIKVGGVWTWQQPTYVKLKKITLPTGRKLTVKACIRSAQYDYWHRGQDLWTCTGDLLTWSRLLAPVRPGLRELLRARCWNEALRELLADADGRRFSRSASERVRVNHFWQVPVLGVQRWIWPLVLLAEIHRPHVVQTNQALAVLARAHQWVWTLQLLRKMRTSGLAARESKGESETDREMRDS
eukprot:s4255_g7.t1